MGIKTLHQLKSLKIRAEFERGSGGRIIFPHPVSLEPPFRPFDYGDLSEVDMAFLNIDKPFESRPIKRFLNQFFSVPGRRFSPDEFFYRDNTSFMQIYPSMEDDINPLSSEQFILSLQKVKEPVSFEILGDKDKIVCQVHCTKSDLPLIQNQLAGLYLQTQTLITEEDFWASFLEDFESVVIVPYALSNFYVYPLKIFNKFNDPLIVLFSVLENLEAGQFGGLQIIWYPAKGNWANNIQCASRNEFDPRKPSLSLEPDLIKQAEQKIEKPFFATIINIIASNHQIARNLETYLCLFSTTYNSLERVNIFEDYPSEVLKQAVLGRLSYHYGMLLNSAELAGLFHLPSKDISSQKLIRPKIKTVPAPEAALSGELILGQNIHRGKTTTIRLSKEQRRQHTYIVGSTGVGKTTLILNMALQDIYSHAGLAVFDPHGDLVEREILPRIPEERWDDVIWFDPADDEYPIGLNVLYAKTEQEREILTDDVVSIFRRLSPNWGQRLDAIISNAVLSILANPKGGTLLELRRFLIDDNFREEWLNEIKNPDILDFWEYEFPLFPKSALGPVLTRLNAFRRRRRIQNIVCQKESKINFREIMDEGKIFLCKLAHGAIGRENAYLLGSLICSRLQQQVMTRQELEEGKRKDFYLYIDEFQHFVTKSMETILSEARKYRMGLILAHQGLQQILGYDRTVFESLISNPLTRICFRLGDDDARRLEKGFSKFEAEDLLNLGLGETIARIEKAEYCFNMKTFPPPSLPDKSQEIKQEIIDRSRQKYGTKREILEQELRERRDNKNLPRETDDFYY